VPHEPCARHPTLAGRFAELLRHPIRETDGHTSHGSHPMPRIGIQTANALAANFRKSFLSWRLTVRSAAARERLVDRPPRVYVGNIQFL